MPIYEYKCAKCGVVEVMQSIKDAPLKKCPQCKSKVERMISSTSFVLKGSGWYATDYAKKGATPPASDTASAANGSNGSASTSDTSKAADKSDSKSESKPSAPTEKAASTTKPSSSS